MAKYNVEYFETIRHIIQVEAKDEGEACDKATEFYCGDDEECGVLIDKEGTEGEIGEVELVI